MCKIWLHTELIDSSSKTQFQIRLPRTGLVVKGILITAMDDSAAVEKKFHLHRGSIWLRDTSATEVFYTSEFKFSFLDYSIESPHFNAFSPYVGARNIAQNKGFQNEFEMVNSQLDSNIIQGYFESDIKSKLPFLLRIYLKIEG